MRSTNSRPTRALKSAAKAVLPPAVVQQLRTIPVLGQLRRARSRFAAAGTEPEWLDYGMIDVYQRAYTEPPVYPYDPESLLKRGEERAASLLRILPNKDARDFLEMACWDAMVSLAFQRRGKTAVAVDIATTGLDQRALRGGVRFVQMDVQKMDFPDQSFDVLCCYEGFEHFPRPADVLGEAYRVLRPGGCLYMEFGPFYLTAWGGHLYRSIHVPYGQLLFSRPDIERYIAEHQLKPWKFDRMNRYRIHQFRELWREFSSRLRAVRYEEVLDVTHLELIERHPTCFRSKTDDFNELILANIVALFRKVG